MDFVKYIKTRVIKVFSTQTEKPITKDMIYSDLRSGLGLGSTEILKAIVMIEKLYHIPISDDECENFKTMNDYIQFVNKYYQNKYHCIVRNSENTT